MLAFQPLQDDKTGQKSEEVVKQRARIALVLAIIICEGKVEYRVYCAPANERCNTLRGPIFQAVGLMREDSVGQPLSRMGALELEWPKCEIRKSLPFAQVSKGAASQPNVGDVSGA